MIIQELKQTNKFDCLPPEIADNYKMVPCVMKYEITQEALDECEEYIDKTIEMWEALNHDSDKQFPPRSFTRIQKNGKEVQDIFFTTYIQIITLF